MENGNNNNNNNDARSKKEGRGFWSKLGKGNKSFYKPQWAEVMPGVYISSLPNESILDALDVENLSLMIYCVESGEVKESNLPKSDLDIRKFFVPLESNRHGYLDQPSYSQLLKQCAWAVGQALEVISQGGKVAWCCGSGKGRSLTEMIATLVFLPERVNEAITAANANQAANTGTDEHEETLKTINPQDSLKRKAQKVYAWLKKTQPAYAFDPFEKLETDIVAILEEYLSLHPERVVSTEVGDYADDGPMEASTDESSDESSDEEDEEGLGDAPGP